MSELLMTRPVIPAAERLIVALDIPMGAPRKDAGSRLAKLLGEYVVWYKIGLGMLATGGMELASELKNADKKVFLDLKLFDIPQTIENSVRGLVPHRPDYLTVHGDPHVVRAAIEGRGDATTKILAVTVLTNLDREDLDQMLLKGGPVADIVLERASKAFEAGADGIIASAQEASLIRELPEARGKRIVTPGVRPKGSRTHDQKRVATPSEAVKLGADQVVLGRPIIEAKRPLEMARRVLSELSPA